VPAGLAGEREYTSKSAAKCIVLEVAAVPRFTADFDEDGDVDGADLLEWRGNFGVNGFSDADDDGDFDGADFLAWQRRLGSGLLGLAAVHPIPEPCAVALIPMVAMFWLLSVSRGVRTLENRWFDDAPRRSRKAPYFTRAELMGSRHEVGMSLNG
jgi:hypothetical protein